MKDYEIKCDFGRLYGNRFAALAGEKPHSVFVAKGSEVAVYKGAQLIDG